MNLAKNNVNISPIYSTYTLKQILEPYNLIFLTTDDKEISDVRYNQRERSNYYCTNISMFSIFFIFKLREEIVVNI